MEPKKCVGCGKEFTPAKSSGKFCSIQCYVEYERRTKKRTFECLNCGEPFVPAKSTAKFCSYKCFLKYRRKEIADIKQEEKEKKKREHEEWQSLSSADKSLFGKMKERNPDLTRKEFLERLKQK